MKKNTGMTQFAENEIRRRILKGELYTKEMARAMADTDVKVNTCYLAKMMTIAVNRGCGIGKKRFEEKVQPVLDSILDEWYDNVDTVDQEYAMSVVDRMYVQIMEE